MAYSSQHHSNKPKRHRSNVIDHIFEQSSASPGLLARHHHHSPTRRQKSHPSAPRKTKKTKINNRNPPDFLQTDAAPREKTKKTKNKNNPPEFLQADAAAAMMKLADSMNRKNNSSSSSSSSSRDKKRKRESHDDEEKQQQLPVVHKKARTTTIAKKKANNKNSPHQETKQEKFKKNRGKPAFVLHNLRNLTRKKIPWNNHHATYEEQPVEDLEMEIAQFATYVRLDEAERNSRQDFVANVQQVVQKIHPQAKVDVFGSFATPAVCNFTSDVDLVITNAIPSPSHMRFVSECIPNRTMVETNKRKKETRMLRSHVIDERKQVWLAALDDVMDKTSNHNNKGSDGSGTESNPIFVITTSDDDTADPLKGDSSDSVDTSTDRNLTESIYNNDGNTNVAVTTTITTPSTNHHRKKYRVQERRQVVDCLSALRRPLRRLDSIQGIQLIAKARVPILKVCTKCSIEADICLQEGQMTDTRLFAAECVQRYGQRFSDVVLVLKMLLHQHSLDVPFSGGLGSFKLYALLSRYLALHPTNDPQSLAFVLLGFFKSFAQYRQEIYTFDLHHTDGPTEVDLTNVTFMDDIRQLFQACQKRLEEHEKLASILDVTKLSEDRERSRRLSSTGPPGQNVAPPLRVNRRQVEMDRPLSAIR